MMTWALYYHDESDSLFWSEEWPNDGQCEDVTYVDRFMDAAEKRGLKCPGKMRDRDDADEKFFEVSSEVTSSGKSSIADAIVKSYVKWERKPADLYPTPVEATEALIPVLKTMKRPDGKPIKKIWEPSCGDGRIARVLEWHGFEVIGTDIREYPGYGFGGIDFVNDDPVETLGWDPRDDVDLILGNPPFSLAEEFIRKARQYCPNVIMLLKQTYWNTKGRSEGLWRDETPSLELKLTWRLAFLKKERGKSPLMDCMWVCWFEDHIAEDDKGRPYCATEPLAKKQYPGYPDIGLMPALQVLEGEMHELSKLLRGHNG